MTNEMTISHAYSLWSETYNGETRWSDEDKASWIKSATYDGFDAEEAAAYYDQTREETQNTID